MKNERDNAKSSLLELEIAKHECEEGLSKQDNEIKMKIAQLTTEKETLEVTLGLREQELKARKEELRDDKVKYTRNNRVQCYLWIIGVIFKEIQKTSVNYFALILGAI